MGMFDGFFNYGYEDEAEGRCSGCFNCRTVYTNGAWQFKGCYHEPYHGKWVAEIKNCPKGKIED